VDGGSGVLTFRPSATGGERRTITARIEIGGFVLGEPTVAHFRTATQRPGAVRGLRLRRRLGTVTADWAPAPSAARYSVIVQLSNGSQTVFRLPERTRSIRLTRISRFEGGTIVVRALSVYDGAGPARTARWRAIATPPTRFGPFGQLRRQR
jgi:hypothetical protein